MKTRDELLREQQIGKPGSPKRLYWEFKHCFGSFPGALGLWNKIGFSQQSKNRQG